jgi:hypothetical protein
MIDVAAWLLIGLVALLLLVHRRQLAPIWFRTEDPSVICIFRMMLGSLLFLYIHDLSALESYLFSGDGLFTGGRARERFGDERWSLLYYVDSPQVVSAYTWTLRASCVALAIGFATSVSKWLTLLLLLGLIARNSIFLSGEHVFASFLFLLCLSRCGQAYSVDAWIRRRRGLHPSADRGIPSWPHHLMILQMVPMLFGNGIAKDGLEWRLGNAFYYVLNHPWYQPAPMWGVSELFGTNLFRVMTWTTHAFEILFPLVVVGRVLEVYRAEMLEPLRGPALWISRVLTVAIGGVIVWFSTLQWGHHRHLPYFAVISLGLCLCFSVPLLVLARRIPERVLRWIVGRRVWATLLLLFSAQLFFVLEIGWFTGVVMCTTLLLFDGDDIGRASAWLRRRPAPESPARLAPVAGYRRRALIAILSAWHVIAITSTVLPPREPKSRWRQLLQRPTTVWVNGTVGWQSWRMFSDAPTKPHDLEIYLRDEAGVEHPVGDGLLIHDDSDQALNKRHKIRTNLIKSRGYRRAHAHWLCRTFSDAVINEVRFDVVHRPTLSPEALEEYGAREAVERMEHLRSARTLAVISCMNDEQDRQDAIPNQ